ncbi:hypothetical protein ATC03_10590 [Agromyces aureus]|uniref:Uncharacterized protein n=1 Tax=Agromyces aureus TaxID=453304 RepID=A0A191WFZ9_9MICO|nr:hypothetical protein ATC03_10590 [Agromyces aureus]
MAEAMSTQVSPQSRHMAIDGGRVIPGLTVEALTIRTPGESQLRQITGYLGSVDGLASRAQRASSSCRPW